jgi:UDP-N-acetylglucosamine--N-acetylmuramyl-(pentapeptide) pyrophosphoryl-undecaprenol N-acetylglucosamine transferase
LQARRINSAAPVLHPAERALEIMKKIVLTGGGTLGHVTPHLALIPHLQEKGYEIHYIGTEKGMEREKMESVPGVTYHAVKSGKLRRYFSWQNFTDPFRVIAGAFQASHVIGKLKPDVVFSKGGFVAVPVVFGAWVHHVPVLCHESDLTPGLANKLCKPFAKRFATTFPECAAALGDKAEMTGTPLRPELFKGERAKGLSLLHFDGSKPVLLMMGGSSGAQSVNKALREALPKLTAQFDVAHICGKGNLDASLEGTAGYTQVEFLDADLPDALAAADLVLSRAGSNALCEFQALAKPLLLVPYPKGASRGDQILNAQSYEKRGLCHVLLQENMTADTLTDALMKTWADREQLAAAVKAAPPADGTKRVLEMIEEIQK